MRDFAGYVRQHLSRRDVPDRFDEIVEELAAELESRYTTLVERGAREDEAWSAALAQIPSWSSFAHDLSQATGAPPAREQRPSRVPRPLAVDRWLQDLKLAVRVLRKDRGFALTAIATLTTVSASIQPEARITSAAVIAPSEPSASEITCR